MMTPEEAAERLLPAYRKAEFVEFSVWQNNSRIMREVIGDQSVLTINGAKRAYVSGDIEVDELEKRIEAIMVAEDYLYGRSTAYDPVDALEVLQAPKAGLA